MLCRDSNLEELNRCGACVAFPCRARNVLLEPHHHSSACLTQQLAAPGFHVIYLPFADDVRQPEMDRAFTGSQVCVRYGGDGRGCSGCKLQYHGRTSL